MSEDVSNTGHLSTEQRKAIEALAAGATKEQAAMLADRTVRTLDRWISEDATFAEAMKEAQSAAVQDAARRLAGLLAKALDALERLLEKPGVQDKDRLRAIHITIDRAMRLSEFAELEERITALEEQFGGGTT